MGVVPRYGPNRVAPIVMALDTAQIKTYRERAQGESKDIHLGVGGTGDEKKANEAEHGHHQSDDKVTHIAFHLHLSWAAVRKLSG
jgi:hypothetical protein